MSFIADAIGLILRETATGKNPTPHVRKLGSRRQVVTINGEEHEEILPEPLYHRTALTLQSIADQINAFDGASSMIYVTEQLIQVVLDDTYRDEMIVLDTVASEAMRDLQSMLRGVSQAELVKTLRTSLAGAVNHDQFLAIVRDLEFDNQSRAAAKTSRQSESMGRSVEREVRAGAGEIPETVNVSINRFAVPSDIASVVHIECAVHLDLQKETIALIPIGDCVKQETDRVIQAMIEKLKSLCEDVPVFHGAAMTNGND